ncbi:MAG: hypothetical protein WDM88_00785 [Galbitalea sp.]
MNGHGRIFIGLAVAVAVAVVVVVLAAAVWGAVHSTVGSALFLFAAAVVFLVLVLGVPWLAVGLIASSSRKRQRAYASFVDGADRLGFGTLLTPTLSRRLRSAGHRMPAAFRARIFAKAVFVVATPSGVQLNRARVVESVEISWHDVADVSFAFSGRPELRFPAVVISLLRPNGSVDLSFVAARADPAAAQSIAREFQARRESFGTSSETATAVPRDRAVG